MSIKYTENNVTACSVIILISALILLIVAPIPALTKPIDVKEKVVYGRIARILIIIMVIVFIVLCAFDLVYTAKIITVTILAVTILAILGEIKYNLYKREDAAFKHDCDNV